jgi:hypothetical protein
MDPIGPKSFFGVSCKPLKGIAGTTGREPVASPAAKRNSLARAESCPTDSKETGQHKTHKSRSAGIEICGTGNPADETVRALIDEWVVPNLVDVFLESIGLRSGRVIKLDETGTEKCSCRESVKNSAAAQEKI